MLLLIVIMVIVIGTQINTFVVKVANLLGYQLIWKTLNRADRLILLDIDERAKDITKQLRKLIGVIELLLKGLTIGPN
jgi:hypothetical protein